jgi:peptide/nickel transport system permease protein
VIRRIAARLGWAVFVVWAVVTLTFAVQNLLPGDPALMVAGPQARPADVTRIRAQLGLDRAPIEQYQIFIKRLVHGGPRAIDPKATPDHATCAATLPLGPARALHFDLGKSFQFRRPVIDILVERVPRTFVLAVAAVLVQLILGVVSGVIAARKRNRAADHALVGASLLGISAPTYIIGIALQYVFAYKLRVLPLDGYGTTFGDHVRGILLPALTLGVFGAAYYTRFVRDEMIGLSKQDFVRTARAKGMSEWRATTVHALRNAAIPLVTMVGLDLGALMGGAIVTERIFRWPGIGQLAIEAMLNRDGPLIMGTVIVASSAIVLSNLLVDACYGALDPRVRK